MRDGLDPITLEVIRNALSATSDEMALIILRSAHSPVVRDVMDYSTGLCDAQGRVIAQGLTLPIQLCSFPRLMRHVLDRYAGDLAEGDVLIANDPYGSGGQHLPDIYVIAPVFVGGRLVGFGTTVAHHTDVGGIVPGSVAIFATEIQQEGLRLPLLKLYEGRRPNRTLFEIIARNTRQPDDVIGDLEAQVAACAAAERGLAAIVARYGADLFERCVEALHDLAEAAMRETIRSLPDGRYEAEDFIDGLGEEPTPLRIAVAVTVTGDSLRIDFEGTSPQVEASINCPISLPESAAFAAIRCLAQEDLPNCEGYLRPIGVSAPEGSLLNPRYPAACGARGVVGYRVFDAIMQALAKVVPERAIAGCEGGPFLIGAGGVHKGRPFVLNEMLVGTWGARAEKDGIEGISNPAANLSNQPIELIEAEMPVEIVRYGFVTDSGGPGRRRGGLAFEREFRFLAPTRFVLRGDRRAVPPYGLTGGSAGRPSEHLLTRAGEEAASMLPTMPMTAFAAGPGDLLRIVGAGGGGSGDPFAREADRVLLDVREGKVSVEAARRDYGVALSPDGVSLDERATQDLRDGATRR